MSHTYMLPMEEIRREHVVSNSRFIATIAPVFSADEARTFISRIKKEFSDAAHNVPAYIIGGGKSVTEYCSDDGEPSGTSGKPALAVLRGSGLGDVAVVITRYFGGVLLGTGGLVKAYTEATQSVVTSVKRGKRVLVNVIRLIFPYHLLNRTRKLSGEFQGKILREDFTEIVTMTLEIPQETLDRFLVMVKELSAGTTQFEVTGEKEVILPNR